MKKVNIKPYVVAVPTDEGIKPVPYNVVSSIENIMLANGNVTSQRLTMAETLRKARIAEKIKAAEKEGYVLLEDADFSEVEKSFKAFSGFGKNEVQLCKRIEDVEDIKPEDIKVKKKNKK